MNMWIYAIGWLIIGGIITGTIKTFLGVKSTSNRKYGVLIYDTIGVIVLIILAYLFFSALAGGFIKSIEIVP